MMFPICYSEVEHDDDGGTTTRIWAGDYIGYASLPPEGLWFQHWTDPKRANALGDEW